MSREGGAGVVGARGARSSLVCVLTSGPRRIQGLVLSMVSLRQSLSVTGLAMLRAVRRFAGCAACAHAAVSRYTLRLGTLQ